MGLEPTTPCLRGRCSNQLSYWPVLILICLAMCNSLKNPWLVRAQVLIVINGETSFSYAAELLVRVNANYAWFASRRNRNVANNQQIKL